MMYEIRSRDVLTYLNELGYKNIEAHQLKAFMTDLKKLIKHDNYSSQELHNVNVLLNDYKTYSTSPTTDITEVEANAGRSVTVQISKPRLPSHNGYNVASDCNITDVTRKQDSKISCPVRTMSNKARSMSMLSVPSSSTMSCLDNQSYEKTRRRIHKGVSESTVVTRPTSSFIRVKGPPLKPCRSDPVALYHYYEERWKHTKIPGQDSHLDLRWAIREKMLGDHV